MDNGLVNLSRLLYQMKQENEKLKERNNDLQERMMTNEENIIVTMCACVELYEMLLSVEGVATYGLKDGMFRMASAMVNVYVNLIKRGLKTIDDVPAKLRAEVEEELNKGE